jgi:uncharacterized RDD family membrane protein YckC
VSQHKENRIHQIDALTLVLERPTDRGGVEFYRVCGVGTRFLAGLYDALIQGVIFSFVAFAAGQLGLPVNLSLWLTAFIMWHVVYHLVFEIITEGQSPGKNVFGIRVVSCDGNPATIGQYVQRNVARLIDFLPVGYLLGGTVALFDEVPRRMGDRIAHTLVVSDETFSDMLLRIGCGTAAYNTSPDAYLLEGYIFRRRMLPQDVAMPLAEAIARHLAHRYALLEDSDLADLYQRRAFDRFLEMVYLRERMAQHSEDFDAPANE